MHVNQISILPLQHLLVKTVSQVTLPLTSIATIPSTLSGIPKPNWYYNMTESLTQHVLEQHLFIMAILKIVGAKLPSPLLCTIVNTSPYEIVLPKHRHICEIEILNASDNPTESLMISKIMCKIDSDQTDTKLAQTSKFPKNSTYTQIKPSNELKLMPKISIIMPSAIQIHRKMPFTDAKIAKETKDKLYEMLQKYERIISKGDNDIGQTDLIHMHIAMKPNATPIAAWPYPLVLKDNDFLKQEIKNLLDARII